MTIIGVSIAGMKEVVQKGIAVLWIGTNTYLGRSPFDTPSVFHWQMPDGNKGFVYLNLGYNSGFGLFNANWRQGAVPVASNLRYRPPKQGDFFSTQEDNVLKAHRRCCEQLNLIHFDDLMNQEHADEHNERRA